MPPSWDTIGAPPMLRAALARGISAEDLTKPRADFVFQNSQDGQADAIFQHVEPTVITVPSKRRCESKQRKREEGQHRKKVKSEGVTSAVLQTDIKREKTGFAATPTKTPLPEAEEATYIRYQRGGIIVRDGSGAVVVAVTPTSAKSCLNGDNALLSDLTSILHHHSPAKRKDECKREVKLSYTAGEHTGQGETKMWWAEGVPYQDDFVDLVKNISKYMQYHHHRLFPNQQYLERPHALFGGNDLSCFNSPPRVETCPKCKLVRRMGAVHTGMHNDSRNDILRCCQVHVKGSFEWRTRHCLFFSHLGIIVPVPPSCTAYFGSSLLKHGNINLIDHFEPEAIQVMCGLEQPYTAELDQADADVEVRSSLVNFNQGSSRRVDIRDGAPWTKDRRDVCARTEQQLAELFAHSWPSDFSCPNDEREASSGKERVSNM